MNWIETLINKIDNIKYNSNFTLILDNREKYIIKLIGNAPFVETQNLDVGDIHFLIDNELILVIERKTLKDLSSSIKDGRFREQKARLSVLNCEMLYLIEGFILNKLFTNLYQHKLNGIPITTLLGAQTNIMIRDNIKIIRTSCMEETIFYILDICKKLKKSGKILINNTKFNNDYVHSIKLNKKANIDKHNCLILQLAQIPGVSINMAKAITNECTSLYYLCNAYLSLESEKQKRKLLQNIEYFTNNNTRKIGKVVSKRIYEYIVMNNIQP